MAPRPAILALVAVAAACHGPVTGGRGHPLPIGAPPPGPATGLRIAATPARGVLGYGVGFAGSALVTVELGLEFDLVVRDPAPRLRLAIGDPTYDIDDLAVDPDGERAWVASRAGTVRAIDLASGEVATSWHLGAMATAVAPSPNRTYVATGTATGVVCLRRRRDGALLQCVAAHHGAVSALDFSAAGDRLVSASWDGTVTVWQIPSLAVLATHRVSSSANDVAFAPAGDRIAIAVSGQPPRRSPEVAARERRGGTHDPDARVEVWRPTDRAVTECRGHTGLVTAVAWTPDGARLLSTSWDRTVRMWDPASGRAIATLRGFQQLVRDVAVSADGRRAAVAAWSSDLDSRAVVVLDLLYP